jgi:hypothetical protein
MKYAKTIMVAAALALAVGEAQAVGLTTWCPECPTEWDATLRAWTDLAWKAGDKYAAASQAPSLGVWSSEAHSVSAIAANLGITRENLVAAMEGDSYYRQMVRDFERHILIEACLANVKQHRQSGAPPVHSEAAPETKAPDNPFMENLLFALKVVTIKLSVPLAIATTANPDLVTWLPFWLTLIGALICPAESIARRYRLVVCLVWTGVSAILATLGYWLGKIDIVSGFLIGLEHPELRPLTDWLAHDHGLSFAMILWPVGPLGLWIFIMFQIFVGCAVMKILRCWGATRKPFKPDQIVPL